MYVPIKRIDHPKKKLMLFFFLFFTDCVGQPLSFLGVYEVFSFVVTLTEAINNLWENVTFGHLSSHERLIIWTTKRLSAYTASVWAIAHRVLYYTLAVGIVVCRSWTSLRPVSLYMATPMLFLVAYNLLGCVFEAARSQGEMHAVSKRIQVIRFYFSGKAT